MFLKLFLLCFLKHFVCPFLYKIIKNTPLKYEIATILRVSNAILINPSAMIFYLLFLHIMNIKMFLLRIMILKVLYDLKKYFVTF